MKSGAGVYTFACMQASIAAPLEGGLPSDWHRQLRDEFPKPYWQQLQSFLAGQRSAATVLPPTEDVFSAFHYTPFDDVKVLILGQDPYHGLGQAHGLSFSVRPGIKIPPSLRNIYKELQSDLGSAPPQTGYLESWATQGVLMINAVMTVRQSEANSHKGQGWEQFTDKVITTLSERSAPLVFVLWGGYAKKKTKHIDQSVHTIISSGHPSPLSIKHFRDTKPFSKINAALSDMGKTPIDWTIANPATECND